MEIVNKIKKVVRKIDTGSFVALVSVLIAVMLYIAISEIIKERSLKVNFICPENYKDFDSLQAGNTQFIESYKKNNSEATLYEYMTYRYDTLVANKCTKSIETIKNNNEYSFSYGCPDYSENREESEKNTEKDILAYMSKYPDTWMEQYSYDRYNSFIVNGCVDTLQNIKDNSGVTTAEEYRDHTIKNTQ